MPGDPEASVLFLSVDRSSAGDCDPPDMPRGGAKWSQDNIDKLKAWIEAGASKD